MKHKLSTTLALVVLTLAIAAATARAQTVANGPYYAPPAWDQTLPVATRFIVLSNFASAAVLDRETGLVWQRSPSTSQSDWAFASVLKCMNANIGTRKGWRLPTVQELMSLIDQTQTSPALPIGHPFSNVQSAALAAYWTATADAGDPSRAYTVAFFQGNLFSNSLKSSNAYAWCVRSGQGVDAQ